MRDRDLAWKNKSKAERSVTSNWCHLLRTEEETGASVSVEVPIEDKEIFLVHDILSREECQRLITGAEDYGYGETSYPKDYRGNLRLVASDVGLAEVLWQRLKSCPRIPETIVEGGGNYEVVGLNSCWRLSKYFPGDRFQAHVDGVYRSNDAILKSMFTVNIYLNEDFTDGETVFHVNGGSEKKRKAALREKMTSHVIAPKAGLCLVFRQPPTEHFLHEGMKVSHGTKYLLRTDIMYRRV